MTFICVGFYNNHTTLFATFPYNRCDSREQSFVGVKTEQTLSFSNLNRKLYLILTVQTAVEAPNIFPLDGSLTVLLYRFRFKLEKLTGKH